MSRRINRIRGFAISSREAVRRLHGAPWRTVATALLATLGHADAALAQETRGNTTARPWESDSSQAHAKLRQSIAEFHVLWQADWRHSEEARAQVVGRSPLHVRRLPYIHCHAELKSGDVFLAGFNEAVARPDSQFQPITSAASNFAVCPSWLFSSTVLSAREETHWRDAALLDIWRARSQRTRARLLRVLDSAGSASPSDPWISGQRVRFHVDQVDLDRARDAAQSCMGTRWWCAALQGFVAYRANRFAEADSLFSAMREAMPEDERCVWDDWPALLPPHERRDVRDEKTCGSAGEATARFWWLAQPLWRDAWNERRLEQEARRVSITLHQALAQDERFVWDARRGGDAIAEMMYRYGWPTYTAWGGRQVDVSHSQYLALEGNPPAAPYTTFEYAYGRAHTAPSAASFRSPFESEASAWHVTRQNSLGAYIVDWWPHEHFLPLRPLVDLPAGQSVQFRRQNQILEAAAMTLQASSLRPASSADVTSADSLIDLLLMSSRAPGSVDSIALVTVKSGAVVRFREMIAAAPQILSMEARCQQSRCGDARWRFGVQPPPTLSTMRRGEVAISAPAILSVPNVSTPANARIFDQPREDLLDLLHPTTHLAAGERRIGVYWESYGLDAGDTVIVAIRVGLDTTLSRMRRVGVALGVASDPSSEVTVQWTEPNAARSTRTLAGPIPVQLRSVLLDLSPLKPGTYTLEVSAQRPRGTPVRAGQKIILR